MKPIRRALIVDDEVDARAKLRQLLAAHSEVQIVGEAEDVSEAIQAFQTLKPNLIFLDVQMPKRDGFSLLPELQPLPDIIFTTAYDAFAVKAFEVNAVDYLMKPIHPERLQLALARISRTAKRQAKPFSSDDHIFLRSDLEMRVVLASNISHIEAEGNYSRVHIAHNGSMFVRRKMREWFDLLPSNIFSRVHRSMLINLWAVRDIIPEPHEHARVRFVGSESPVELTRRGARRLRQAMQDITSV